MAVSREPRWQKRYVQIDRGYDEIRLPHKDMPQNEEWFEVIVDGRTRKLRCHDYGEIYRIPGLYEGIFYEHLGCCSPSRVVGLLTDVVEDFGGDPSELRVLDVGAGNGMVGDEFRAASADAVVGIDIIEEAKTSTLRDRDGVYDDYLIADLTDLDEHAEERLRRYRFNCLTTVAALGFGDIPAQAFAKALDLVSVPGWMAFNIKEDFLHEEDNTGFSRLIRQLSVERVIQTQAYRRYRHRFSVNGKPLHYVAMVAKKLRDMPDEIMEQWGA